MKRLLLPALFLLLNLGADGREPIDVWDFSSVEIRADFPTARVNDCRRGLGSYHIDISPESIPINPSPWYCFKITSDREKTVHVTIHYTHARHRYWPKISRDGRCWTRLEASRIKETRRGKKVRLILDVDPQGLWVSAQEIIDNRQYEDFVRAMSHKDGVSFRVLGPTVEGRPIFILETTPKSPANSLGNVVLVGRQHPPEVSGAIAMLGFIETVLSDAPLAQAFRQRFRLLMVPNLNPDGVAHGHWRMNAAGVDLNRDWGPFTQPETRLMQSVLHRFEDDKEGALTLMVDFHSTRRNLMYTQEVGMESQPSDLAFDWHTAITGRLPDIPFFLVPTPDSDDPISKRYVSRTFGAPSVIFEVGDETDRDQVHQLATVAAQEMMRILMESR